MSGINIKEYITVVTQAVKEHKKKLDRLKKERLFLSYRTIRMDDLVVKKTFSYFDSAFGIDSENIGRVVGYDFENDLYRVYFNDDNPYVGIKESELKHYSNIERISARCGESLEKSV